MTTPNSECSSGAASEENVNLSSSIPLDDGLRMIEFFSGIGGMRLSVQNALGDDKSCFVRHCQAYDISIHANRTYKHNFPRDDKYVSTKLVEQLKPRDLDGKAELWTMSPPCQPFTTTRGAKGLDMDDKRCNGLKGIMKLLCDINVKPRYILLENVKGFATSQMVQQWYECLKQNGYTWKEYLLSPMHFGIPNHRQRYYILCERSNRWLDLQHTSPQTSYDNATTLPTMRRLGDYIEDRMSSDHAQILLVPKAVLEQPWAKHLSIVTSMDRETYCFTAGYGRIFHNATGSLLLMPPISDSTVEVDAQQLPVVRPIVETDLDRSDMTKYYGQLRRFSPRELVNLFGFPPNFSFPPDISLEHQYKLIGNSVNVSVVTKLFQELLSTLPNPQQQPKEGNMMVGGTKGHQIEYIHGALQTLYENYRWKMIPNCTGRYTCRDHKLVTTLPPLDVLDRVGIHATDGDDLPLVEYKFSLPGRKDPIVVVPLDSNKTTGVITFVKGDSDDDDDAHYVHTLNTVSGFRRKLEAIGIEVNETTIRYVGIRHKS